MKKREEMQVNVAGLRRNLKNIAHNYSDAQVSKVLIVFLHMFIFLLLNTLTIILTIQQYFDLVNCMLNLISHASKIPPK